MKQCGQPISGSDSFQISSFRFPFSHFLFRVSRLIFHLSDFSFQISSFIFNIYLIFGHPEKIKLLRMKLMEGKVALITGGSRGIGKGIAMKLAEHGADIAFTFMSSAEKAKGVEKELENLGVKAKGYQSDAADYTAAEQLIKEVLEDFGKIDAVVNNAGITRDGLLMRMTPENWDEVMNTNLKSVFNITKHVQRSMLKQRSGSIINMSSIVGVKGNAGQSNYAASKAGIIGFTKSIAQELGSRNIRCNAIAPGFIETEMTGELGEETMEAWLKTIPMNRPGTTEDVANAVLYLASDLSAYVSGQTLSVCGAMLT
jgi:3-oxoacyl-[acyl-carrier protein] reductase